MNKIRQIISLHNNEVERTFLKVQVFAVCVIISIAFGVQNVSFCQHLSFKPIAWLVTQSLVHHYREMFLFCAASSKAYLWSIVYGLLPFQLLLLLYLS